MCVMRVGFSFSSAYDQFLQMAIVGHSYFYHTQKVGFRHSTW